MPPLSTTKEGYSNALKEGGHNTGLFTGPREKFRRSGRKYNEERKTKERKTLYRVLRGEGLHGSNHGRSGGGRNVEEPRTYLIG